VTAPGVARRLIAMAWSLAAASCANLGALECQGDACQDASAGGGAAPGITCGGGSTCAAGAQECCVAGGGATSCTRTSTCNGGTDIVCDDPRQCPGGGPCWICITSQGFQGTSCNYQGDIVGQYHCDMTTALPLCRLSSQCAGGKTCAPLAVEGLDAGAGQTWFSACR